MPERSTPTRDLAKTEIGRMVVRFPAIIAALGLAALAACAAPQTEFRTTQSNRPLVIEGLRAAVGDSWTYRNFQTDTGNTNRTWVETVLTVDEEGITTRRIDRLPPANREQPAVDRAQRFGEGLYNFPLYVGKSWESTNTRNGEAVGTSSYRVVASEVIDTAVGRVEALKIEMSFTIDGQEIQQLFWYAPSVRNVVRLHYIGNVQATELVRYHLSD